MRSQKPAPLPQNRPRRSAISGETAERSARIECSIWRDTPSCRAVSATVRLSAGSTSSRRIAPGWTGSILGGCLAEYSDIVGSSVVLLKVYSQSIAVFPFKGDTPRTIDRERIAGGLTLKLMESPSWHAQLPQVLHLVECRQPRSHAVD